MRAMVLAMACGRVASFLLQQAQPLHLTPRQALRAGTLGLSMSSKAWSPGGSERAGGGRDRDSRGNRDSGWSNSGEDWKPRRDSGGSSSGRDWRPRRESSGTGRGGSGGEWNGDSSRGVRRGSSAGGGGGGKDWQARKEGTGGGWDDRNRARGLDSRRGGQPRPGARQGGREGNSNSWGRDRSRPAPRGNFSDDMEVEDQSEWDGGASDEWEGEGEGENEWKSRRGDRREVSEWMKNEMDFDELEKFDSIYGITPVYSALLSKRRAIVQLLVQEGVTPKERKDKAAFASIMRLAEEQGLKVVSRDKGYLNSVCGNRPHQGFVLRAKPLDYESISALPAPGETDNPVWLALDEVTDPQNLGALLRSAYFFGASGVVVSARNSASLTPTVSKASAGALEAMTVHSTSNMMKFLRESRANGWRVVGTQVGESSVPLSEIEAGLPSIIVLGNEGRGMRTNVVRECEILAEIPGSSSREPVVDSLNVSVTGALMLHALTTNLSKETLNGA